MEKNYISKIKDTHFYVNMEDKKYGVCININDIERQDEILKHFYNDKETKETINAWRKTWGYSTKK